MFAAGLILLLFSDYATESLPDLSMYISFFAMVLWGIAAIFIIVSRSPGDKPSFPRRKRKS